MKKRDRGKFWTKNRDCPSKSGTVGGYGIISGGIGVGQGLACEQEDKKYGASFREIASASRLQQCAAIYIIYIANAHLAVMNIIIQCGPD